MMMMPEVDHLSNVQSIGAAPCGLAITRYLNSRSLIAPYRSKRIACMWPIQANMSKYFVICQSNGAWISKQRRKQ